MLNKPWLPALMPLVLLPQVIPRVVFRLQLQQKFVPSYRTRFAESAFLWTLAQKRLLAFVRKPL
jgi:hypothetical protein